MQLIVNKDNIMTANTAGTNRQGLMTSAQILAGSRLNWTTSRWAKFSLSARHGLSFWVIVTATLLAAPVFGEGFRNPPPGTFDLSRAGGRIAQVDDSSAITANPANLVDVGQTQINIAPSIIYYHVSFENPAGAEVDTKNPVKLLPNFYASMPVFNSNSAIGLGVSVPYGIANEWNSDLTSPLRYSAPYFTELKTINFTPAFSTKLGDHFQTGLGLDVMWSELTFNQFLTPLVPGLEGRARGYGVGLGVNAGLTYKITDRQRLALTVRSPMTVHYDGKFTLSSAPGPSESDFNSQIRYPTIVSVGYGLQPMDKFRLETDLEWIEFSRFNNLPVNIGANPAGVPSQTIPQNWHNTITIGISSDYQITTNLTVRGGYQFYETPVPDETFSPTIPDANQNVITMGLNYHHKRSDFEVGYGLDFYDHRDISNNQVPAFNGHYAFTVHLFSLSYRYSF